MNIDEKKKLKSTKASRFYYRCTYSYRCNL